MWFACQEGAFKADNPTHACEVARSYGLKDVSISGPFETKEQAEQRGKVMVKCEYHRKDLVQHTRRFSDWSGGRSA